MYAEDHPDVVQMSLVDDVDGTAGDTLLGRLEDEPNPSTRWMVSEVQPGPQHDRGVHIVATGVCDSLDVGAVRGVAFVVHGKRVDVRAER